MHDGISHGSSSAWQVPIDVVLHDRTIKANTLAYHAMPRQYTLSTARCCHVALDTNRYFTPYPASTSQYPQFLVADRSVSRSTRQHLPVSTGTILHNALNIAQCPVGTHRFHLTQHSQTRLARTRELPMGRATQHCRSTSMQKPRGNCQCVHSRLRAPLPTTRHASLHQPIPTSTHKHRFARHGLACDSTKYPVGTHGTVLHNSK